MRNGTEVLINNAVVAAELRNGIIVSELRDGIIIRRKWTCSELRARYGEQYAAVAHRLRHLDSIRHHESLLWLRLRAPMVWSSSTVEHCSSH